MKKQLFDLLEENMSVIRKNNIDEIIYDFDGGDCALIIYENHSPIYSHTHNFDELVFVLSGTALHIADDEEYPLIRGDVFTIHGNHKHSFRNTQNFHIANLLYKKDFFEKMKDEFSDLPGFQALFINEPRYRKNHKFESKLHLNSHQLNEITKFIFALEKEEEERRVGFKKMQTRIFESIVIEICRYYTETDKPKSKVLLNISTAIDYMEKNYTEPATIRLLAKKVYMSTSHFRCAFKKITGLSPINFLIRLRIEKATEMIANNSNLNVTEIAIRSGFENSAYFSRQFKKITGIAPIAYIKKQKAMLK
ncbi:helix-turn-helix domain-containing protein [bacterium]|nr:helix-turn-helix domain-containing protein [bacterium]